MLYWHWTDWNSCSNSNLWSKILFLSAYLHTRIPMTQYTVAALFLQSSTMSPWSRTTLTDNLCSYSAIDITLTIMRILLCESIPDVYSQILSKWKMWPIDFCSSNFTANRYINHVNDTRYYFWNRYMNNIHYCQHFKSKIRLPVFLQLLTVICYICLTFDMIIGLWQNIKCFNRV